MCIIWSIFKHPYEPWMILMICHFTLRALVWLWYKSVPIPPAWPFPQLLLLSFDIKRSNRLPAWVGLTSAGMSVCEPASEYSRGMDSSELASDGLLPHSSCCEPESSWKPSFNTASFWTNRTGWKLQIRGTEKLTNLQRETGTEHKENGTDEWIIISGWMNCDLCGDCVWWLKLWWNVDELSMKQS